MLDLLSLFGNITSILGLGISIYSFLKIRNVETILQTKSQIRIVISEIESIMKINENESLSEGDNRRISKLKDKIKTVLKKINKNDDFVNTDINSIEQELKSYNPNIPNIKESFKSLKKIIKE